MVCETTRCGTSTQLNIGHAVSNPSDKFDKKIGEVIATNRLNHQNVDNMLFSSGLESKFMSPKYVEDSADLLANFVKDNLHIVIKGYK